MSNHLDVNASVNADQYDVMDGEMIDATTQTTQVAWEHPTGSLGVTNTAGTTQDTPLVHAQTVGASATSWTDEIAYMENSGLFGFASVTDALEYMEDVSLERDNLVMLVQPMRGNAGDDTSAISIPTRTRGRLLTTPIPHQLFSHEKSIQQYYCQQAEEDVALENLLRAGVDFDTALKTLDTNRKTQDSQDQSSNHIDAATRNLIHNPGKPFGDWWLASGGKFRVVAEDTSDQDLKKALNDRAEVETFDLDLLDLDLDLNLDFEDLPGTVEPTKVDILNLDKDTELAQLLATVGKSNQTQIKRGKYLVGPYTGRRHPPGAIRIWRESGLKVTPTMASESRREHPIFSHAPPACVDIRLLGDIYVTAHELLTFFPSHGCYWPDYTKRLASAHWKTYHICQMTYMVRGELLETNEVADMVARDCSRTWHYKVKVGLKDGYVPPLYTDLTCVQWADPRPDYTLGPNLRTQLTDYYVSDLADGVPPELYPTGENAGPLTDVIRYVQESLLLPECQSLTLRGVAELAKQLGLFRTAAQAGLDTVGLPYYYTHADHVATNTGKYKIKRKH